MTESLLSIAGMVLILGGLALRLGGVIGTRRCWLCYWVGEAFWTVREAAFGNGGWVLLYGAATAAGYWVWRHSDDDDDRWRRLLAWGRSKIPRPTVVRLRPALEER